MLKKYSQHTFKRCWKCKKNSAKTSLKQSVDTKPPENYFPLKALAVN